MHRLVGSLAVTFVTLSHGPGLAEKELIRVFHVPSVGALGVMIFFVHTCLVLMLSLERQTAYSGRFCSSHCRMTRCSASGAAS